MGKTKGSKSKGSKPTSKPAVSKPSAEELISQAYAYLAQSNFEQAINCLALALDTDPSNVEAREVLGIAEIDGGDVEKGREHLLQLLPPKVPNPTPSTYLYLAQTAATPQDALSLYQSAATLLETKIGSMTDDVPVQDTTTEGAGDIGETKAEVVKECITAIVAMIEIWMSDLCFEPNASTECDTLIARALQLDNQDVDALLTQSSILMSQSKPEEAKSVILHISTLVLDVIDRIEKAEDEGEAALENSESMDQGMDMVGRDLLPPIPTRHLLTRLLLEHHLYVPALRVNDSVRREDELEVEGCYLEGWAWFCRGEAIEAGEEGVSEQRLEGEDELPTKVECWTEALSSFLECASMHEAQDHPDEGILAHVKELVTQMEQAGIVVEVDEEDAQMQEGGEGDVEMA